MPKSYRRREVIMKWTDGGQASEELRLSGLVRSLELVFSGKLVTAVGAGAFKWNHVLNLVRNLTLRLEQKQILKSGSLWDFWFRQAVRRKVPRIKTLPTAAGTYEWRVIVPLDFIRPGSTSPLDTLLDMNRFDRLDLELQFGKADDAITATGTNGTATFSDVQLEVYSDVVGSDVAPRAFFLENAYNLPTIAKGSADSPGLEYRLITAPNTEIAALWLNLMAIDEGTYKGDKVVDPSVMSDIQVRETVGGQVDVVWEYANGQDALRHYFEQMSWSSQWVAPTITANTNPTTTQTPPQGWASTDFLAPVPIVFGGLYEGRSSFDLKTGQANDLRLVYSLENDAVYDRYVRLLEDRISYAYAVI